MVTFDPFDPIKPLAPLDVRVLMDSPMYYRWIPLNGVIRCN